MTMTVHTVHFNWDNEVSTAPEAKKKQLESETIKAQRQLNHIMEIVNASDSEKKKLNYTLDAAHSLGYDIYKCAKKLDDVDKMECMLIAKEALKLVAEAYTKISVFSQALNVLNCLNSEDVKELREMILVKWKNYIEKLHSHTRDAEQFMYERQLNNLTKV